MKMRRYPLPKEVVDILEERRHKAMKANRNMRITKIQFAKMELLPRLKLDIKGVPIGKKRKRK